MPTSELLPTVVVSAATAVFAVGLIRLQRKHRALAPMRESAARDPAILRVSTAVKPLLRPGIWSTKTSGVPPKSWRSPYAASGWRAAVVSNVTGDIIAAEL